MNEIYLGDLYPGFGRETLYGQTVSGTTRTGMSTKEVVSSGDSNIWIGMIIIIAGMLLFNFI